MDVDALSGRAEPVSALAHLRFESALGRLGRSEAGVDRLGDAPLQRDRIELTGHRDDRDLRCA